MKNKTESEVEKESEEMTDIIFNQFGECNCEILTAVYSEVINKSDLEALIDSVNVMSMVDTVAMGYDWQTSKNCRLEHTIAKKYNIPVIYLEELQKKKELN